MKFPVKRIVLPSDLVGQPNGQLDQKLLVAVKPSGMLHHKAAAAWDSLRAAAAAKSIDLVHVGAYRTYREQYILFRRRYSKQPTGREPEVTRIWNGATWYLRKKVAPSASPGSSNHGLGISVDVALRVDGKVVPISADPDGDGPLRSGVTWLRRNAVKHGWCWEISDSDDPNFEAWHLVYFAGDISTKPQTAQTTPDPTPKGTQP